MSKRTVKTELRIRPLFFLTFLCTFIMVSSRTDAFLENEGKAFLTENNIRKFIFQKRFYNFFNHCSERQIEIIGSSITALGQPDSPNSDLILQTAHFENHYGVNIIGERSGRFVCFNRKSKLITRFSGASPRCIFEEHFSADRMYSVLRSVYNPEWCVGFNSKGKPILGSEHVKTHRNKCFHFTKRNHPYLNDLHQQQTPKMIPHPNRLLHLLKDRKDRKRKIRRSNHDTR